MLIGVCVFIKKCCVVKGNMASTVTDWLILAVICFCVGSASSFLSLEVKAGNTVQKDHPSMLECTIKITKDVEELVILNVVWKKAEKSLLLYDKGRISPAESRFQFAEPSWNNKNMNVSLLITNTKLTDAGEDYLCIVSTSSGVSKMGTRLDVTAKYNTPTIQSSPTKIAYDMDFNLRCQSKGGYPQGQLRWFDKDGAEWTKSSYMNVTQMEDGLFSLFSELSVLQGSMSSKYTCAVYNANGGREEQVPFDVASNLGQSGVQPSEDSRPAAGVVAPLLVVGSLIVGLLLLLLMLYRKKRRRENRPVRGEESDEEEGALDKFCTQSDLRKAAE
ncbi:CD276 antigen-like isoform X2 [Genypterus blacodes]|uniref:CD276 antigen-like isoform X2 n=1 Tax=Genypterus blacodes TaxID=154954 RepID=UPI003F75D85E